MRLYLETLRNELGLSVSAVSERISEKIGLKIRCRPIETGHYWATITQERAEVLAYAYSTTPENILALEEAEGRWEGKNYYGVSTQTYDTSVWDKPLTFEEKELCTAYFDCASVKAM